jgi:hypothetical protein
LISRTMWRGTTALAPALRLFFVTASDMWHPCCDLTRDWSALDHDCAANACHDIGWDDRRWNGCASSSLSYSTARRLPRTCTFLVSGRYFLAPIDDRFTEGSCDCGHAEHTGAPRLAAAAFSVALIAGNGHARDVFAVIRAADFGEPHEHANRVAFRQAAKCARWLSHGAAKSDSRSGEP